MANFAPTLALRNYHYAAAKLMVQIYSKSEKSAETLECYSILHGLE
ncbi:MAG: hypothetical protein ACI37O_05780 [Candidatus Avelusimicrobium sp.]